MTALERRRKVGEVLRKLREATGLSQEEVCGYLDRPNSQASYSRLEKPKAGAASQAAEGKVLDLLLAEDLVRLYGVPLSVLETVPAKVRSKRPRNRADILSMVGSSGGVRIVPELHGNEPFTIDEHGRAWLVQRSKRFETMEERGELKRVALPRGRGERYVYVAVSGRRKGSRSNSGNSREAE